MQENLKATTQPVLLLNSVTSFEIGIMMRVPDSDQDEVVKCLGGNKQVERLFAVNPDAIQFDQEDKYEGKTKVKGLTKWLPITVMGKDGDKFNVRWPQVEGQLDPCLSVHNIRLSADYFAGGDPVLDGPFRGPRPLIPRGEGYPFPEKTISDIESVLPGQGGDVEIYEWCGKRWTGAPKHYCEHYNFGDIRMRHLGTVRADKGSTFNITFSMTWDGILQFKVQEAQDPQGKPSKVIEGLPVGKWEGDFRPSTAGDAITRVPVLMERRKALGNLLELEWLQHGAVAEVCCEEHIVYSDTNRFNVYLKELTDKHNKDISVKQFKMPLRMPAVCRTVVRGHCVRFNTRQYMTDAESGCKLPMSSKAAVVRVDDIDTGPLDPTGVGGSVEEDFGGALKLLIRRQKPTVTITTAQCSKPEDFCVFETPMEARLSRLSHLATSKGVAVIALCHSALLDKGVVLKRFPLNGQDADAELSRKDALRELQAMAFLKEHKHANLLELLGAWCGSGGDHLYIATPKLCMTMRNWLDDVGKAPVQANRDTERLYAEVRKSKCNDLVVALLKGVHHMHKAGMMHRDIKPENILIKDQDDLSTAAIFDNDTVRNYRQYFSEAEQSSAWPTAPPKQTPGVAYIGYKDWQQKGEVKGGDFVAGTPGYCFGGNETHLWDIWSVGSTAYELLRYPHELLEDAGTRARHLSDSKHYQELELRKSNTQEELAKWLREDRVLHDIGGGVSADEDQVQLIAHLVHPNTANRMSAREALVFLKEKPDDSWLREFIHALPKSNGKEHMCEHIQDVLRGLHALIPDTRMGHNVAPAAAAAAGGGGWADDPAEAAELNRRRSPRNYVRVRRGNGGGDGQRDALPLDANGDGAQRAAGAAAAAAGGAVPAFVSGHPADGGGAAVSLRADAPPCDLLHGEKRQRPVKNHHDAWLDVGEDAAAGDGGALPGEEDVGGGELHSEDAGVDRTPDRPSGRRKTEWADGRGSSPRRTGTAHRPWAAASSGEEWSCGHCTLKNEAGAEACATCGTLR